MYLVKVICISFLFLFIRANSLAQTPELRTVNICSQQLDTCILIDVHVPAEYDPSSSARYPVIYLFDSQNELNYGLNLETIRYYTMLGDMPPCIVVGIPLGADIRNEYTTFESEDDRGADFIEFLSSDIHQWLDQEYKLNGMNILIGHSRTAIFSSYALSAKPDFFGAAICSSSSYFDFDNTFQEKQFESFLEQIKDSPQQYYYYFSSGKNDFGDAHEESVSKMKKWLESKNLPSNFRWNCRQENVGHFTIPGLTVGPALCDLFSEYTGALNRAFKILEDPANAQKMPWEKYLNSYRDISDHYHSKFQPDLLFYYSVASSYYNDYQNVFGINKLKFTIEILEHGIENFPHEADLYDFLGSVYLEKGDTLQGNIYLTKASDLTKFMNSSLPKEQKINNENNDSWNLDLLKQDCSNYREHPEVFEGLPLSAMPFPVADYEYAVASFPLKYVTKEVSMAGIAIADYESYDDTIPDYAFQLLLLGDITSYSESNSVSSRNFPNLSAQGYLKNDQTSFDWIFSKIPDKASQAFVNTKLFDLSLGETVVVWPVNKGEYFAYLQIEDSRNNYNDDKEYLESIAQKMILHLKNK